MVILCSFLEFFVVYLTVIRIFKIKIFKKSNYFRSGVHETLLILLDTTLCENDFYISSVGKVKPITDITSNKYRLTVSYASEIFHIILIVMKKHIFSKQTFNQLGTSEARKKILSYI